MNTEKLLEHFKTKTKIANALEITPQAVQQWFTDGKVPITRQYQIQVVTKGKLKAAADNAA